MQRQISYLNNILVYSVCKLILNIVYCIQLTYAFLLCKVQSVPFTTFGTVYTTSWIDKKWFSYDFAEKRRSQLKMLTHLSHDFVYAYVLFQSSIKKMMHNFTV